MTTPTVDSTASATAGKDFRRSEVDEREEPVRVASRSFRLAQALIVLVFAFTVWRLAWVTDDALISIRSALNAHEGMGLVYNAGERVQAYTHPLWFFVILGLGTVTGSWIYSVVYAGIALSTVAAAMVVSIVRTWSRLLFVAAALLLSNSVLEWTTSGLEGCLAILLLTALFVAYSSEASLGRLAVVGLLSAALVLTRMDYLLLVAPLVIYALWRSRRSWKEFGVLAGSFVIPVIGWMVFSLIYYGTPFPTTFTAKTNTTISTSELVTQGLRYLQVSSVFDVAAPILFVIAMIVAISVGTVRGRLLMAGTAVYLGYVVWVGGDFMAGRFFLVPVFGCLLVVADSRMNPKDGSAEESPSWLAPLLIFGTAAIIVGTASQSLFWRSGVPDEPVLPEYGVSDERAFWSRFGAALDPLVARPAPSIEVPMQLALLESKADSWQFFDPQPPNQVSVACGGLGNAGLSQGPKWHLIDTCGLTDRFMAMIPYSPTGAWRIGHFERPIPLNYVQAVVWNDPTFVEDPELREKLIRLWDRIR